jgi:hypothetical protein
MKKISGKNFLTIIARASFLHSWEWGEFQQSLGYPIIRLGLFNE